MRLLADNPSMDFLRREAKDVLAALRESSGEATLSDAQRTLAEEYGFRTWNELKAEVERRREHLPAAPAGLAEGLSDAFGLGVVTAITPIRYEYTGRRWCLESDRGRCLVTPVFDWQSDETQRVGVDLQERARAVGVRSSVPVRTADGGLVRRVQEQNWRVDEWIDLGPTPGLPLHTSVAQRLGAILAAIHSVAPKTDRPIAGTWVADRPSQESWSVLLENARAANKPWADEFAALSRNVGELSTITTSHSQDEVVISNRDLQAGTVRFGPADDLVVVHWDFAGPTTMDGELASLLAQSALHSTDTAAAVIAGYRDRSNGHVPKLTLNSFAGYITGWLTWANHRACEAIAPADADAAEFAERSIREVFDDRLTIDQLTALLDAAN